MVEFWRPYDRWEIVEAYNVTYNVTYDATPCYDNDNDSRLPARTSSTRTSPLWIILQLWVMERYGIVEFNVPLDTV